MGRIARGDRLPRGFLRRRRLFLTVVAGPVGGLLVGLAVNAASTQAWWLELVRTHPWGSLAVCEAVAVCLAVLVDRNQRANALVGDPDLAGVADDLAVAVRRQWDKEVGRRQLDDPYAMPVQWGPSDPDLVADWRALVRLATTASGWPRPPDGTWAADPAGLTGTNNDLVDVLDQVPTRRLVVLGEPGAGKTILLVRLVLDLLERRRPGEAVPVLLPLSSWNPADQGLHSWIERWLITNHSALAGPAPGGTGSSRAKALVDQRLILPVLDGLDEIPPAVRGSALAQISRAMRPGEPLVLAARTAEFRTAVCPPGGAGVRLAGAAGITLFPLDVSAVSDYLRDSDDLRDSAGGSRSTAATRWDEVLSTFTADCPPPVAQALTTPLLVALARAIYNPRPGEDLDAVPRHPAELLDPARFATPKDVERHLFDSFIRAAYRPHPDRPCPWTADQAERWLVFLARDLENRQRGTTDLAWWKLSGAAPRPLAGISVGFVAGLVGAVGFPFPMAFGLGLMSALLVGLSVRKWVRRGPTGLTKGVAGGLLGGLLGALGAVAVFGAGTGNAFVGSLLAGGLALGIAVAPLARFAAGLAGGLVGGFVTAFLPYADIVHEIDVNFGPVARLINGLGVGLAAGLAVGLAGRSAPARELRWSPDGFRCGLAGGLGTGLVAWIQAGPTGGLVAGLASTIVFGYAGGLSEATSADLTKATTPKAVLERDRTTFRSSCLRLGLSVGFSAGLTIALSAPDGFRVGLGVGLANLIAVGLPCGFLQASYGSFTLARWRLAVSGHLPWRLVTFLDDAHTRGVLRQVGAVYQFRHVELQRRLATDQRPVGRVVQRHQEAPRVRPIRVPMSEA